MWLFQPVLNGARALLAPMINVKTARTVTTLAGAAMNHAPLPEAMRGAILGWVVKGLALIALEALLLSLAAWGERKEKRLAPYWRGRGRSYWIALLLGLFLGGLGAHRFYLRRRISGLLQLLGLAPLVAGSLLLASAQVADYMRLSDRVTGGVVLLAIGLAFALWRLLDLFRILFGGLVPRPSKG